MRKPFNVEAAKSGAKVVTRDGKPARILVYDLKDENYKLAVAIQTQSEEPYSEEVYSFTEDGRYNKKSPNYKDLFIEEEPTIRPYANAAEMDADIIKHGCIVMSKNSKDRRSIRSYHEVYVALGGLKAIQTYECLFKMYTWLDGTPCGIMEGGEDE